jgi:UDP-N-acetylmuramoyl-L-alanyl-D-glutamate--2,6-diaminopimelate ligase
LQKTLAEMRDAGVNAVVMEVSSHALKQHRSDGIAFDVAVFTNLTPEHMDYHPDLEDYFRAKARLFEPDSTSPKALRSIVNISNPYGERLANELKARKQWVTEFGMSSDAMRLTKSGVEGQFLGVDVHCVLEGDFNRVNIQGAIGAAQALSLTSEAIAKGLKSLKGVPGRMERVPGVGGVEPRVYVDYAHKPDALQKVLESLQKLSKKIITIFGCGGDRDRTKRPVMGKIAAELSAWVVVTSDNPRTENPDAIIQEILAGIPENKRDRVHVEADRREAIIKAIHDAPSDATILIAGKGHEDYQILGTQKFPMSDVAIAAEALQSRPRESR